MVEILKVEGLKKVYGEKETHQTVALNRIDFTVDNGEFVGIMGASGSGKTTLLNLIAALDKPTAGSISFQNKIINQSTEQQLARFRANKLGFIFQNFSLLDNLTARENIALPLMLQNKPSKLIKKRIKQVADILTITKNLDQYPATLSGGQQQRIAAARALIGNPQLILADEPTGALDSQTAEKLLQLLVEINQKEKVAMLMVTHDPVAASYCKRILFIKDGFIFKNLWKRKTRKDFYPAILDTLRQLN